MIKGMTNLLRLTKERPWPLLAVLLLAACGGLPEIEPTPTRYAVTPIPEGVTLTLEARFVREDDPALGIDFVTIDYPAGWAWDASRLAFGNTQQALDALRRAVGFHQPETGDMVGEILPLSFPLLEDRYDLGEDAAADEVLEAVITRIAEQEILPEFAPFELFDVRTGEAARTRYTVQDTDVIALAVPGWNGYALLSIAAPQGEADVYLPTLMAMADTLDVVMLDTP